MLSVNHPEMNLAVLVGNGLSVAVESKLGLMNITAEMVERVHDSADDGSNSVRALKNLAIRAFPAEVDHDRDFEKLVGFYGAEGESLEYLSDLARALDSKDSQVRTAIEMARDFAIRVRDLAVSHILEIIHSQARLTSDSDKSQPLKDLVQAIVSGFSGHITIGNLNYDTLLLAALTATIPSEFADLGSQYGGSVDVGGRPATLKLLRDKYSNFPDRNSYRVRLLNLHGSLTFWRDERGRFFKVRSSEIETLDLFSKVRSGATTLRPVVVLTSQQDKESVICEHPFDIAYAGFRESLDHSNSWLIVGYSFRDIPVNTMLRESFQNGERPTVLVVTYGYDLRRSEIEAALGWSDSNEDSDRWLTIYREGALDLVGSDAWSRFVR